MTRPSPATISSCRLSFCSCNLNNTQYLYVFPSVHSEFTVGGLDGWGCLSFPQPVIGTLADHCKSGPSVHLHWQFSIIDLHCTTYGLEGELETLTNAYAEASVSFSAVPVATTEWVFWGLAAFFVLFQFCEGLPEFAFLLQHTRTKHPFFLHKWHSASLDWHSVATLHISSTLLVACMTYCSRLLPVLGRGFGMCFPWGSNSINW